jgi:thioredoxin-related protein
MINKSLLGLFLLSIATLTTFPCHASTKELSNRENSNSGLMVQAPNSTVYILLYKTVNNTEAIHTIFYKNRNKVLMFEKQEDAKAFAQQLKKQNFPAPSLEAILESEVRAFCLTSNHDCELVRAGADLKPPTQDGRWEGVEKIFCDAKECNPSKDNP